MASNAIIKISSSSEDEAMNEQLQQLVGDMESLQSPTKSENLDNAHLKRRQERTANEEPTQIASLKRKIVMSYWTHKHTKEFRCQVLTAVNGNDERLDKGILYYYFKNNIEVPVRMMPHGNAKNPTAEPHVSTERNILKKLKDECQQDTGKSAVDNVFLEMGSIYDLKYQSELPRNTKQAYNIAYQSTLKAKNASDSNETRLKRPAKHQFYDILEMVNDETPVGFRSILGIDGAHNCGEFYITLTTYHHPFIENKATGRPLLMIGPSVTHATKTDEDYQCFLQQLDTHSQLINKK
eukprot:gene21288-23361_t